VGSDNFLESLHFKRWPERNRVVIVLSRVSFYDFGQMFKTYSYIYSRDNC
jgi:hypothetical protein